MRCIFLLFSFLLTVNTQAEFVEKSLSGTEYFRLFNYNQEKLKNEIPFFEDRLIKLANDIIAYSDANPNYKKTKHYSTPEKMGLILVYVSMFVMNNNNGAIEGIIDQRTLTKARTFSTEKNMTLKGEVIARYMYAQKLLEKALILAKSDIRIPSWYAANLLRLEKYKTGKVSEKTLGEIMDLARHDPIFHLFNALTMASDYDFGEKREEELFKLVEFLSSKDSPCYPPFFRTGEAKKCNTTEKTPFAFQGVSVYMGDAYLKKAAREINKGEHDKANFYLDRANALYQQINWFVFKKKFKKWGMKHLALERMELVKQAKVTKKIDIDFFRSKNYLDIYTCTSCHQDGLAEKSFHLKLP